MKSYLKLSLAIVAVSGLICAFIHVNNVLVLNRSIDTLVSAKFAYTYHGVQTRGRTRSETQEKCIKRGIAYDKVSERGYPALGIALLCNGGGSMYFR